MAFSRPTLQQIVDRIKADLVSKITGATTFALRSVLLIMGTAYAGAVHLLYGFLENMSKELFAKTATADADGGKLDTMGSEYGILRKAATPAVGSAGSTGNTPATAVPAGTSLSSPTGNKYLTTAIATVTAGGVLTVLLQCDTVGVAGNDSAAVVLSFDSPIAGIGSTVVVDASGLYNGTDVENDDAYRLRILERKQFAPHGGAGEDLEVWAKELSYVTRAWAYPQYNGPGTVALYFACDAQTPITPTPTQIAAVLAYLTLHTDIKGQQIGVPVTMLPGLFVLSPVIHQIDLTVRVYPNTTAVQDAVTAQIVDFIYREAYPGQKVYMSRLGEAISAALGEERSAIVIPAADFTLAYNEVGVLGTITWQDY